MACVQSCGVCNDRERICSSTFDNYVARSFNESLRFIKQLSIQHTEHRKEPHFIPLPRSIAICTLTGRLGTLSQ